MKTKHTPLPWSQNGNAISSERGNIVFAIGFNTDPKMQIENAALIVRAVNSHDDLVDALEKCHRVLSDLPSTNQSGTRTRKAFEHARAALAKARGE